jgi:hypothetical protein
MTTFKDAGITLLLTSSGFYLPVYYAYQLGKYKYAIMCWCVASASCNHWRNPHYGISRNMDLLASRGSFLYVVAATTSQPPERRPPVWAALGGIALSYLSSYAFQYFNSKRWVWAHVCMHICVLRVMTLTVFTFQP